MQHIIPAREIPPSLRLSKRERHALRVAVLRKWKHLIPQSKNMPREQLFYEADRMIDAMFEETHQKLIKQQVDNKLDTRNVYA